MECYKKNLTSEFNLHTVVRMPHSVFATYTSITTNILFFDRTFPTRETWFYRLNMPEGYKNFSKTKPLLWNDGKTVQKYRLTTLIRLKSIRSKKLQIETIISTFAVSPHEEEKILPPKEIIHQYQEKRASLNADIDSILAQITDIITFIVPCLCRI